MASSSGGGAAALWRRRRHGVGGIHIGWNFFLENYFLSFCIQVIREISIRIKPYADFGFLEKNGQNFSGWIKGIYKEESKEVNYSWDR